MDAADIRLASTWLSVSRPVDDIAEIRARSDEDETHVSGELARLLHPRQGRERTQSVIEGVPRGPFELTEVKKNRIR